MRKHGHGSKLFWPQGGLRIESYTRAHPMVSWIGLGTLGAVLGVLLGWLALREVEWSRVWIALQRFPTGFLMLGLAAVLAAAYLRAMRWKVLFLASQPRTHRLFLIETACNGLNNVSPARVLAEPVQLGLLTLRDRLDAGEVVATLVLTRSLDLVVTLSTLVAILALLPVLLPFAPLVAAATFTSAIGIVVFTAAAFNVHRVPLLRKIGFIRNLPEAARALRERPLRVLASLGLTAAYWLLTGLIGWLVSVGVGHALEPYAAIAVILGAVFFATSVPGLPAALGTFEFAIVFLLEFLDVPTETAVTMAILLHTVLFLPQIVIMSVVLPREGIGSVRALRSTMVR